MARVFGNGGLIIQISMKVNMKMIRNVGLGFLPGLLVTFIRVIILMTCDMATGKCIGWMAPIIRECGKEVYSMEMVK